MTEETKHACPCGTSSDAFSIYEGDNGVHCWSCDGDNIPKDYFTYRAKSKKIGHFEEDILESYLNGETEVMDKVETAVPTVKVEGVPRFQDLKDRGIKRATCEYYGVKSTETSQLYPYYDKNNTKVATKMRGPNKLFQWGPKGDPSKITLFGQQAFASGRKDSKYDNIITITEGELDAMAARQMMGNKYSFVSIPHGAASAVKAVRKAEVYEYLDSFDKIILCLDNDAEGIKATKALAEILDAKKVYTFKHLKGTKDANDYLLMGKATEFSRRYWDAEKYSPDDIIIPTDESFKQEVLYGKKTISYAYPWGCWNEKLRGFRMGEMVTVIADTGVGKSQFMRELEHYSATTKFANGDELKVGIIHIEETPRGSMIGLMSVDLGERLHLKDAPMGAAQDGVEYIAPKTEKISGAVEEAYDKLSQRVAFYREWGSNDADNIMNKIKFFVKAFGCKMIFLDHISMIVSDQRHGDERKALDEIASKLKSSTVEWDYNLHVVAHINRQGEIRGTANIEKLSDMVIRLERDTKSDDPVISNVTKSSCEKNRYSGDTGLLGFHEYNKATGGLTETSDPHEFELEN